MWFNVVDVLSLSLGLDDGGGAGVVGLLKVGSPLSIGGRGTVSEHAKSAVNIKI